MGNEKRIWTLVAISVALVVCAAAYHLFPKASPEGDDESRVSVFVGDAVTGEALSNVSVSFIPGRDNPDGEAVCQAVSGDGEETSLLVLPE